VTASRKEQILRRVLLRWWFRVLAERRICSFRRFGRTRCHHLQGVRIWLRWVLKWLGRGNFSIM